MILNNTETGSFVGCKECEAYKSKILKLEEQLGIAKLNLLSIAYEDLTLCEVEKLAQEALEKLRSGEWK